jgi:hypothetical protein
MLVARGRRKEVAEGVSDQAMHHSNTASSDPHSEQRSDDPDLGAALLSFAAEDQHAPQSHHTPGVTARGQRSDLVEARKRLLLSVPFVTLKSKWMLVAMCALLVTATGLALGAYYVRPTRASREISTTSLVLIDSRPQGLVAIVDGQPRGRTPVRLSLPFGTHNMELREGSDSRRLSIVVESGTTTSQFIDFGPEVPPVRTGRLEVSTDVPGSSVKVDGVVSGMTPLALPAVSAGEHKIIVGSGDAAVARTVTIVPGATASVVVSTRQSTAAAGFVRFRAPFEMQVFEGGQLVGTTGAERMMLPAGAHKFDLVSDQLEFRTTTTIQVMPGAVATSIVTIPNGLLSVNALPWADVEVDGRAMGTTPLANISLPIGTHEVVWKNPQLGERRRTIVLTATTPVRVGVDFSQ